MIHRVIDIEESDGSTQFITKGDANDGPDIEPVPPNQVKGKLMLSVPKVGWVTLILRSG